MRTLLTVSAVALVGAPAVAVEVEDFRLETTRALVALCSADVGDPLLDEARTACFSYLAGTVDFYRALTAPGRSFEPFVCPERELTRTELAIVLVDWAAANPGQLDELPVDGVLRAAVEAFPCDDEDQDQDEEGAGP